MLLEIENYKGNSDKRFTAHFENGKIVHFGQKDPKIGTYIDHFDNTIKKNYIKRHKSRENWKDPYKAGTLSRFILWNKPYKNLDDAISDYNYRFFIDLVE